MERSVNYISYVITEIFCILFSIGIIRKSNKNIGTDLQMRHFKGMALFYIVYLISDIVWALGQGGIIPFSRTLNMIASTSGLVAVSLLTLGWCVFIIYRINQNNLKTMQLFIRIYYAVTAADIILTISSNYTHFYFYIDSNNIYQLSSGYVLHLALIFIQLFGSGIYSIVTSCSDRQIRIKKEYQLPLMFVTIPSIAAVLESFLPLTPIVPLGILLPILLSFLEIQSGEIYSDALTGLNNRRRMEIYLQEKIRNAANDKPFRIYLIDVNDFKMVNDKFGHIAGDRALRLIADALRIVAGRLNGFCARFGGDEFVLILDEDAQVQEALQKETDTLRNRCADKLPPLSVCTGCAECRSDTMTATQLIAEADEQLYARKQIFHGKKNPKKDAE